MINDIIVNDDVAGLDRSNGSVEVLVEGTFLNVIAAAGDAMEGKREPRVIKFREALLAHVLKLDAGELTRPCRECIQKTV